MSQLTNKKKRPSGLFSFLHTLDVFWKTPPPWGFLDDGPVYHGHNGDLYGAVVLHVGVCQVSHICHQGYEQSLSMGQFITQERKN